MRLRRLVSACASPVLKPVNGPPASARLDGSSAQAQIDGLLTQAVATDRDWLSAATARFPGPHHIVARGEQRGSRAAHLIEPRVAPRVARPPASDKPHDMPALFL